MQRLQRFATHGRLKRVILTLIADELNKDAAEFSALASSSPSTSSSSSPSPSAALGNSESGSGTVLSSTAIAASASVAAASALFAALDRDASGGVCVSELATGETI